MDKWTTIKTAYYVAKLGTLTAASKKLGIHRATILRHIDFLESEMDNKLFIRHAKGYVPTEVGLELLNVAESTDNNFQELLGVSSRRAGEVSGELIITSLRVAEPMLLPAIHDFHQTYPKVKVQYTVNEELLRLEYGEAHIAVRTGPKPNNPDCVVQPFFKLKMGLYAHKKYIEKYGLPQHTSEFSAHRFVGSDDPKTPVPFSRWLLTKVQPDNFVFTSNDHEVLDNAVSMGEGIGFAIEYYAKQDPNLVNIMPHLDQWDIQFWLLTHGDLHRTQKVQTFLTFLKNKAKQPDILKELGNMNESFF